MELKCTEHVFSSDDQAIAITSAILRGDTIWCGLTSGRNCLVPFCLKNKKFGKPVDIFPWIDERPQIVLAKIHNSLGLLDDGRLVIGEGILFSWDGLPFVIKDDPLFAGSERRIQNGLEPVRLDRISPTDLSKFDMRHLTGGKILLYDPESGSIGLVGKVQPFNYVQSMIVDPKRKVAYGHTIGDCHFFTADLIKQTVIDCGRISTFAFHNMVVAPDGVVYGAWIDFDIENKLRVLRYDPKRGYLERLKDVYLDDPGPRVQGNKGIDQWLIHSSGDIYVGMAGSGVLYKFDPIQLSISEVGRIGKGGRVTTLNEDEYGRIIFTGGFPVMHIGRYDPKTNVIQDFGPVTKQYDKIYFHGSVYKDGIVYLAETDSNVASLWEVELPSCL